MVSAKNEETVRQIYEQLNRGDVEGVVELCDEEFVMDMSERVFNPDIYNGADGIRRFYDGVTEVWDTYRWNIEKTQVAGDEVVAMLHCRGQGRQAGPPVDWRVAWLWRFRDDRPVAVRFYRERSDALAAAGLVE